MSSSHLRGTLPTNAFLGLVGLGAGLVAIIASRILFSRRHHTSFQSFKREFVGFVIAYLVFHPLSLLLAIVSIGVFYNAQADEVTVLFVILAIMVLAGVPAGWFWTKIMRPVR